MEFGEKLKQLRLDNGYSQSGLAKEIYVTRQAVSKWERGLGKPDHETMELISTFFGTTIDELLKKDPFSQTLIPEVSVEPAAPLPAASKTLNNQHTYIEKLQVLFGFFKTIDLHLVLMNIIALTPAILHPGLLFFSYPIMLMAIKYKKRTVFYALTVLGAVLLFSIETLTYISNENGWFVDVEVVPLETQSDDTQSTSDNLLIEDIDETN
ncbi:helix-turn-helix transcriptional regulator [Marinilactibacillus piezotolerans]|uniref:helix-turn-helix transcriptional regulator n=1 Tax=Marinilactibacillus piezotolerans TaxID=258723 RepID=UPI0009AF530D|nr:helix-turn-helix domain-containing protein [Marinilactibacillus piezotolerans]